MTHITCRLVAKNRDHGIRLGTLRSVIEYGLAFLQVTHLMSIILFIPCFKMFYESMKTCFNVFIPEFMFLTTSLLVAISSCSCILSVIGLRGQFSERHFCISASLLEFLHIHFLL